MKEVGGTDLEVSVIQKWAQMLFRIISVYKCYNPTSIKFSCMKNEWKPSKSDHYFAASGLYIIEGYANALTKK